MAGDLCEPPVSNVGAFPTDSVVCKVVYDSFQGELAVLDASRACCPRQDWIKHIDEWAGWINLPLRCTCRWVQKHPKTPTFFGLGDPLRLTTKCLFPNLETGFMVLLTRKYLCVTTRKHFGVRNILILYSFAFILLESVDFFVFGLAESCCDTSRIYPVWSS